MGESLLTVLFQFIAAFFRLPTSDRVSRATLATGLGIAVLGLIPPAPILALESAPKGQFRILPTPAETLFQAEEPTESTSEAPAEAAVEAPPPADPAAQTPPPPAPAAPPAPAVAKPQFGVIRYTVAKGDTLFSIARKVELNLSVLTTINNISDPNAVKAGQVILIPAQPGTVHIAGASDSLRGIADQYQADIGVIRDANRLDRDAKLEAGQLILIPGDVRASGGAIRPITQAAQVSPPQGGASPNPAPKSAQPPDLSQINSRPQNGDLMIWPVTGAISTTFSPSHRGLDIVANQGTPIRSALAGRIIGAAEHDGPYGWFVIVEHGGGFTTVHAHLSKIRVKVGDLVEKGQVVGDVGSTGLSTGPHLHFELRQNNVPIDPRPYLP